MKTFQAILALVLLTIILAPPMIESTHSWTHAYEIGCHDTHSSHCHKIEHQCFVCDLFYTTPYVVEDKLFWIHEPTWFANGQVCHEALIPIVVSIQLKLRGPPESRV
ncbi:MAG: hypothetical protein WBB35_05045 [Saprospiraceae bacterium]